MPAPALHEVTDEFDERNAFLLAALGLLGMAGRFDAFLARHGVPAVPPAHAVLPADDHPLPYLILGLQAVLHRAVAHLDAARGPARSAPPAPPSHAGRPRDLLP